MSYYSGDELVAELREALDSLPIFRFLECNY